MSSNASPSGGSRVVEIVAPPVHDRWAEQLTRIFAEVGIDAVREPSPQSIAAIVLDHDTAAYTPPHFGETVSLYVDIVPSAKDASAHPADGIPLSMKPEWRVVYDLRVLVATVAGIQPPVYPKLLETGMSLDEIERFDLSSHAREILDLATRMAALMDRSSQLDPLAMALIETGIEEQKKRKKASGLLRPSREYHQLRKQDLGTVPLDVLRASRIIRCAPKHFRDRLTTARDLARNTATDKRRYPNKISTRHLVAAVFTNTPAAFLLADEKWREDLIRRAAAARNDDLDVWRTMLGVSSATTTPAPPPGPMSALGAGSSDQPRDEDGGLGFPPYVLAVTEFLTSPDTQAPLTLAIEGPWGSGKSSFMLQVRKQIASCNGDGPEDRSFFTVWFNGWRHDRDEALWAAFALEFMAQIRSQITLWRRFTGGLRLVMLRYSWSDGWLDAIKAFGMLLLLVAITAGALPLLVTAGVGDLLDPKQKLLPSILRGLGAPGLAIVALTLLWKQAISFVGNPFAGELKKHLDMPSYKASVGFADRFHADFAKIVQSYIGADQRVFVFIDDLDRCAIPRAADLIQAIHMLVAGNANVIFVIGMDREKIAASVAAKYKDVLPYLAPDANTHSAALDFGRSSLEKFVQVWFTMPQPKTENVSSFLRMLGLRSKPEPKGTEERPWRYIVNKLGLGVPQAAFAAPAPPRSEETPPTVDDGAERRRAAAITSREELSRVKHVVAQDSDRLHQLAAEVAPCLGYNPRRLTQFINLMRLRTFIAATSGKFASDDPAVARTLTIEQLGKFVALEMLYPHIVAAMAAEPDLLGQLQEAARTRPESIDEKQPSLRVWYERKAALEILALGKTKEGHIAADYDVALLNLNALIEI